MSKKSRKMSAQLLSDYCFIHYNYKYEWLRPAVTEIVAMYKQIYGKKGLPWRRTLLLTTRTQRERTQLKRERELRSRERSEE